MQIHVAIPHYNAPEALRNLLAQLTDQDFDSITVLDDHSTNQQKLQDLAREFPAGIFIFGEKNIGAGANRNRFLNLNKTGVVWFLDCDMRVETLDVPNILRKKFAVGEHIMFGGTILYTSGQPMAWNYGHEMHPQRDQQFTQAVQADDRQTLQQYGWDYPWIWGERVATDRQVDWVAEGSFALMVDDFAKVGGYDAAFRYHEGQDLARRLRAAGVNIMATGDIVCTHLNIEVRGKTRHGKLSSLLGYSTESTTLRPTKMVYNSPYG